MAWQNKVHLQWKNATPKPTKFTKSNIKWPDKVKFVFNERNIIPKPIKFTKVHPKMALVEWGSSSTILDKKHNMHWEMPWNKIEEMWKVKKHQKS